MMKRMLALLLALLLPTIALAESSRLDVTLTVNEANVAEALRTSGAFAGEFNEEGLCSAVARLINGLGMSLHMQDDAYRMELRMAGSSLLDLSFLQQGNDVVMTSDLMEGYGLLLPGAAADISSAFSGIPGHEEELLEDLNGMVAALAAQLAAIPCTSARGAFNGDAFTGGVYCDTYTFDDAQVTALVGTMLTQEARAMLLSAADALGEDGAALLTAMDEKNAQVATENVNRYILRVVKDAERTVIGLSCTVLQGERQVATASLGLREDGACLVVGLPLAQENYWHWHDITVLPEQAENGAVSQRMRGKLLEFTAPKDEAFAYAKQTGTETLLNSGWSLHVTEQAGLIGCQLEITTQRGADTALNTVSVNSIYKPGQRLAANAVISVDDQEHMTLSVVWAPSEPIDTTCAGLEVVDMSTEDGEVQANEIAYAFGTQFGLRLMQLLPPELMMLMMQ